MTFPLKYTPNYHLFRRFINFNEKIVVEIDKRILVEDFRCVYIKV